VVDAMTADVPESARVTVVVMTRNRWTDLRSSLQRHHAHVVLVDNGSTDGTPAKVREHFPEVEVIELPANAGAVARNVGVSRARTPYVAFADDDSWWAPGSLEQAARLMDAHPRLGLLAGRMLVGVHDRRDWICDAMETSPLPAEPDLPGPSILGFLACGAVVRRSAFLAAGGFDGVVFFMGEEERLALDLAAAGWGLAYARDVVAHHHPSEARDSAARRTQAERNRLLTAVMRRPWPVVAAIGWRALTHGRTGRLAILHALPRVPAALRARRPLPPCVEQARRLLETQEARQAAAASREDPVSSTRGSRRRLP
jgi:GT2 family glycosyltransferase